MRNPFQVPLAEASAGSSGVLSPLLQEGKSNFFTTDMFLKAFDQWAVKQSCQSLLSIHISSSLGHSLSLVGSSEIFPFV